MIHFRPSSGSLFYSVRPYIHKKTTGTKSFDRINGQSWDKKDSALHDLEFRRCWYYADADLKLNLIIFNFVHDGWWVDDSSSDTDWQLLLAHLKSTSVMNALGGLTSLPSIGGKVDSRLDSCVPTGLQVVQQVTRIKWIGDGAHKRNERSGDEFSVRFFRWIWRCIAKLGQLYQFFVLVIKYIGVSESGCVDQPRRSIHGVEESIAGQFRWGTSRTEWT